MAVPSVAAVVSATHFDGFVVEVVPHRRFRVSVDEPEKIAVLVFDAVLNFVLLPQEFWRLFVTVMRGPLQIEVFREVGRTVRSEVDTRTEMGNELWQIRLQTLSVSDGER